MKIATCFGILERDKQSLNVQYVDRDILDCDIGVRLVVSEETTTNECGVCKLQLDYIKSIISSNMIVVVDCSRVLSTLYSLETTSSIRMSLDKRNDKDIKHCAKCIQFMIKIIKMGIECITRYNDTIESILSCSQHVYQRLYQLWRHLQKIY